MKLQRILALVGKDLKKMIRDPAILFLILLFPVVLTLAFGFSFGAIGGNQTTSYQIGLVKTTQNQWSLYFYGNLSKIALLDVQPYPHNDTAQADLAQGKIQAIIIVPTDFDASCDTFLKYPADSTQWINTTIPLYLDSGSMFATQAIPPLIHQVLVTTIFGPKSLTVSLPIQISDPSMVQSSKFTMFDYMASGIFAYASIFLTMTVAQSLTTDRENGLLRRINVTPTTATEFMLSQTISNMIGGFIQAVLVFLMAYIVGYRPNVGFANYVLAFIIVLIFSLCNVGFGLITATVAKSSGAATGLSFIFILPQMFLGTFVGIALSAVAQTAGKFVPSYYVTDALTSLFLRGAPVLGPMILFDLTVVSVVSVAALLVGILLFKKYGKT
jgi:ABC-2 type transport system permease protein